ncbi:DNA transfer protein [Salmonella phage 41]|nr:DNA transfer protein [Salmonella phage 41]
MTFSNVTHMLFSLVVSMFKDPKPGVLTESLGLAQAIL